MNSSPIPSPARGSIRCTIFVADNSYYMDEIERDAQSPCDDSESALAAGKRIMDDGLPGALAQGTAADERFMSCALFEGAPWKLAHAGEAHAVLGARQRSAARSRDLSSTK